MRCKCKNPEPKKINGFGLLCEICNCWIIKRRIIFHKPTKVHEKQKGYNRKEAKKQVRKEIEKEGV